MKISQNSASNTIHGLFRICEHIDNLVPLRPEGQQRAELPPCLSAVFLL